MIKILFKITQFLVKINMIKKALSQIKLKEEIKEDNCNPLLNSSLNNNIVNKNNNNNKELSKKINNSKSFEFGHENKFFNSIFLSIYIHNSPPLKEIQKAIKDYYSSNIFYNDNNNILVTPLLNNSVRIDFPNEKILQSFNSYLCFLKYKNQLFKNIIIKKDDISKLRELNLSNNLYLPGIYKKKYNNKLNNILNNKNKLIIKNIIKINKKDKEYLRKKEENKKIIKDYYSKQQYIRNSSPYLSDDEKRRIEEIENKSKFLNHKDFVTSVGKYSTQNKYIPNYVQMSPSQNPSNHQFRVIDKLKWLNKKGFFL